MMRWILSVLVCVAWFGLAERVVGEEERVLSGRRGPWIRYRYPVFREGNRPPEARRYSQEYYWPSDPWERYPKFYGGFHSRYFDEIGRPSGDLGLRGYAW